MFLVSSLFALSIRFVFFRCEVVALLEFKKGMQNDPLNKIVPTWVYSSLSDLTLCHESWPGITCDPITKFVVGITLDRLDLTGDLKFQTLSNLKLLQNLSVSGNRFTAHCSTWICRITILPGRSPELWNLKYVNLSMNTFQGRFPVGLVVSFRNLQQLKVLDLHSNGFSADVGPILSELINLEHLDLSNNQFSGSLGDLSVENVSGLANTVQFVNMNGNSFNGGIFKTYVMGLFRNLHSLDFGDTGITGELPSFGNLLNLRVLRLGMNQLYGVVPEELLNGSLPIEELDLSGNGFTGSIQAVNSVTLNVLNLSSNSLSCTLPSVIKGCSSVDFSRNMVSGNMSDMQHWEANLKILDLSSNKLLGSLPDLSKFGKMAMLNLHNNSLEGSLSPSFGAGFAFYEVDLSFNKLSGSIPSEVTMVIFLFIIISLLINKEI
ncbi:hypothetical protein K2173_002574 [Erythroxylum novogranatense]|uniref:Leucine-rich repeat-containing N-terminal plant-type domain-containing protein n=1 Tax=Erythroxylum novogranatense TaxID=1862640 RepID=A0AAV8TSZ1_9ROSI|nr:hypothetical protein K2173_002574 [Erythroxylum novogranatense]